MANEPSKLIVLVNWVLATTGIINLVAGTWFSATGNTKAGGVAITAGLFLVLAATIERFKVLKGFGLEAQTQDLNQKLKEADQLLEKLQALGDLVGAVLIELHAQIGRVGTAPTAEKAYQFSRDVKAFLDGVGAKPDRVREVLTPWARTNAFDLAQLLSTNLSKALTEASVVLHEQMKALKPADAEFAPLADRSKAISAAAPQFRYMYTWGLSEIPGRLRAQFDQARDLLPPDVKAKLEQELEEWLVELNWLIANLDLQNKAKWFAALRRPE